eukprot:14084420-Alexandrium_andersonii.AAC.1
MHPSGASGSSFEVVSGAAQFKLGVLEGMLVLARSAGVRAFVPIDSMRYSVRSLLGVHVIAYLTAKAPRRLRRSA